MSHKLAINPTLNLLNVYRIAPQARGGGWWKFERRHNEDIEAAFAAGATSTDLLICGKIYTIDLANRVQFVKGSCCNFCLRRRAIKRDRATAESVGVAGLVL